MTAWRPERRDWHAMLAVALVPVLLAIPQLFWLKADPLYYVADILVERAPVIFRDVPYIDPNNGFQTQALGYRAVMDWLSGEVPWWNPYTGIGMPLAAEYQGAVFFPLTALVALPRGMVLLQMALQIFAGLGAYALARQLGLARLAAFAAGAMFAVNGTLAWLAHGPAGAVPWLPWILLGIERAFIAASQRRRGGWRTLAVAMTMSLLAGFPETAYLNGLFALAWAILRGVQAAPAARAGFGLRVAAGGTVAIAIAAPQILSFFLYLYQDSHIAGHAGEYATTRLGGQATLMTLVSPYLFGPIFAYFHQWPSLNVHWGNVGGYASLALIIAALYGFLVRRDALGWLLVIWTTTALAKSFGIEPFLALWNLVPGVTAAAFARFAPPSWELALMLLAARGIDSLLTEGPRRDAWRIACYAGAGMVAAAAMYAVRFWIRMPLGLDSLVLWFIGSAAWAVASTVLVLACIAKPKGAALLACLLAIESAIFCAIPVLSNPREGRLDMAAIDFLRANLGLQRFYSLGPIAPNYGAMFGIASINHNYLPVPQSWVRHVQTKLDRKWSDAVVLNGDPTRNSREELRANLRAYEETGVKYIVAPAYESPLAGVEGVKLAYADSSMKIFELPRPSPYFEAPASCAIDVKERRLATVRCDAPSTLVRRELFYPGWTATVNGAEVPVTRQGDVFQSVALPQGMSEVRFRYAPPHIGWAWLAAALGLAALLYRPRRRD